MMTGLLLLLVSVAFSNGGEADTKSYVELDQGIVKAYNNNPRNTAEVYANAMLILDKALKEEGGSGKEDSSRGSRGELNLRLYGLCQRILRNSHGPRFGHQSGGVTSPGQASRDWLRRGGRSLPRPLGSELRSANSKLLLPGRNQGPSTGCRRGGLRPIWISKYGFRKRWVRGARHTRRRVRAGTWNSPRHRSG